jgi:hypothetical protein
LDILFAIAAAHADGADKFAIDHDRNASWRSGNTGKCEKELMSSFYPVIKSLGRTPISRSRNGLLLRELNCGIGRTVHFREITRSPVGSTTATAFGTPISRAFAIAASAAFWACSIVIGDPKGGAGGGAGCGVPTAG